MESKRDREHAEEVALARYAVIAPLVCRELDTEEFRAELARVSAVAHRFPGGVLKRVPPRTVRRWVAAYREGRWDEEGKQLVEPGLEALEPRPRCDRGQPRVLAPEVVERAVRLRQEKPSRTTRQLVALLKVEARARGEKPPEVRESTLNHHLRACGATRRRLRAQGRVFRRFERDHRNACWQGDMAEGLMLPHPQQPGKLRKCYLHAFIDDHSRYVPHAEFYYRQNLPCLANTFRNAVLQGGIPEEAYCDHGSAYQALQFQKMTARMGTRLLFATEFAPEGKGKIERWIQRCKSELFEEARHADLATLEELNEFLWGWLEHYHTRVHSETRQTPRARWEAGVDRVRWLDPARLVDIFWWEVERKVDKTGCFKLGGNRYPVAEHLVREEVAVRFDPFDLESVRVYHKGVFVETAGPEQLVSRTYRKAQPRRLERPAPLESSVLYRKQLSGDHRRGLQEALDQLQAGKSPDPRGYLTGAEWLGYLKEGLGRSELRPHEQTLAHQFFERFAPLPGEVVRAALERAVEAKGRRLHLRVYLRWVREAVAASRGGGG